MKSLDRYNKQRNEVVHNLFSIKDLNKLAKELDEYALDAEEIIGLLVEYSTNWLILLEGHLRCV